MSTEKNVHGEFRDSLSEIVTRALEMGGDPSQLRDIMSEQCQEVFALPVELPDGATDVSQVVGQHQSKYSYVIGSMDDFASMEELISEFESIKLGGAVTGNMGVYSFKMPYSTSDETALLIGKGMAFCRDWCQDRTLSFMQCEEDCEE